MEEKRVGSCTIEENIYDRIRIMILKCALQREARDGQAESGINILDGSIRELLKRPVDGHPAKFCGGREEEEEESS